jgi:hypothetical protein
LNIREFDRLRADRAAAKRAGNGKPYRALRANSAGPRRRARKEGMLLALSLGSDVDEGEAGIRFQPPPIAPNRKRDG